MRILLITPMPPRAEAPGAIPIVLHAQLAGLRAHHELTLVTPVGDEAGEIDAAIDLRRSGLDLHTVDVRQPRRMLARTGRRWRLASSWAVRRYPWRTVWFAHPRIQHLIDGLLETRSFDVVAVEDNAMGVFRLPRRIPTVLTEHEVRRPRHVEWLPRSPAAWPQWAFRESDWARWRSYQPFVWRRFDLVQVFTEQDAARVSALAPDITERLRVNPFGVDLPLQADLGCEEPDTIVFTGNFTHRPNVDAALWLGREIMPRILARRPGARLRLIGFSPPAEVRALAGQGIDVLGPVERVRPFQERASVILAPVRIGGGMRMKVLHAMALGKPVVTTQRGAEGLTTAGRRPPLALADATEDIADTTARLLGDAQARRQLAADARSFVVEHHSAEAYAARLTSTYEAAITHHARQASRFDP